MYNLHPLSGSRINNEENMAEVPMATKNGLQSLLLSRHWGTTGV